MLIVLYIIQILLCGSLIALVTSSDKEASGLGGAMGGGANAGRAKFKPGYEEQLDNLTKYIAIAFFVFSLLIAHFVS